MDLFRRKSYTYFLFLLYYKRFKIHREQSTLPKPIIFVIIIN